MTVASFVASQKADHGVPHVIYCRTLCVWPSPRQPDTWLCGQQVGVGEA